MTTTPLNPFLRTFSPWALLLAAGCSGESAETFENTQVELGREVGLACILNDEENPNFPGFSQNEINVEQGNGCELGSCVSYYFQGRVSCPDGQEAEGECSTPSGEPVTVPVPAQLPNRPSADHVFCSCRCDGPEGAGPFCQCPSNYTCRPLLEELGVNTDVAGSYCMPTETPTLD